MGENAHPGTFVPKDDNTPAVVQGLSAEDLEGVKAKVAEIAEENKKWEEKEDWKSKDNSWDKKDAPWGADQKDDKKDDKWGQKDDKWGQKDDKWGADKKDDKWG